MAKFDCQSVYQSMNAQAHILLLMYIQLHHTDHLLQVPCKTLPTSLSLHCFWLHRCGCAMFHGAVSMRP